jgi:hypothetical protein
MSSSRCRQTTVFRAIREADGRWEDLPPETDPALAPPPPLKPEDLQIDVTVRFSTGSGVLDEVTSSTVLRDLLNRKRLAHSEAAVADAMGRQVIEPIRALVRAELFDRFNQLTDDWLEGDPKLVEWYELCRHSRSREGRIQDLLQWARIGRQGKTMEELIMRVMSEI